MFVPPFCSFLSIQATNMFFSFASLSLRFYLLFPPHHARLILTTSHLQQDFRHPANFRTRFSFPLSTSTHFFDQIPAPEGYSPRCKTVQESVLILTISCKCYQTLILLLLRKWVLALKWTHVKMFLCCSTP